MPAKGRAHFGVYTESNRVKHAILTNYLRAYLRALSRRVDAYYYIDGFAGAGTYGAEHAGSPIYALQLLAEQSKPATASFVESDPKLFEQLRGTVQHASAKLWSDPTLRCGEFSEHVDEVSTIRFAPRFAASRRSHSSTLAASKGSISMILRPS